MQPVWVALADEDFEDWIYASLETLGFSDTAPFSADSNGKTMLRSLLRPRKYVKPVWQPRLTARMDLSLACSRSPSLGRLLMYFDEMVALLTDA